ncbi:5-methyltetrahydrofolate-homocysteine methyltransferase [Geofilum rubicundum JCM 15548]|uniref:5-methyltetrahydrofolate-homocysteine methyltransferase n=1 Tax=Geofilum rubicundum JCM 15548 TaxID=1236989 RepID=A0A0E9LV86_9BACT|nr:homocysteine S-methyltransferase family protein [Geofilum rubicundum]GAO29164.1 5-methyltetrahydrofolate-homocysteine methyltransferase [Geofilum rubicundum JCM 15548]
MTRTELLHKAARERILLLDGAMGSLIQQYKLTEEGFRGERFTQHPSAVQGNNDLLSLTRPDIISAIHEQYLEAGSDIIETNTFNANSISQADYQMEDLVYELNKASAALAAEAARKFSTADKPRFVAGPWDPPTKQPRCHPM